MIALTERPTGSDALTFSNWSFWLRRFIVAVSLAVWWGGLTFYAAFVVPLGIEQFGGAEQGMLTRHVAIRLNVGGTIVGVCLLAEALWRSPWNLRVVLAISLLSLQVWLWMLHAKLSHWMDVSLSAPLSAGSFYDQHRIYLWVTSAQWLVGLACVCSWCVRLEITAAEDSAADPRSH